MKKWILVFLMLFAILPLVNAAPTLTNVEFNQRQYDWVIDTTGITSAQADLAATARDAASVNALAVGKVKKITLDYGTVAVEFRIRIVGSNNDTNTILVYSMVGDADFYSPVVSLDTILGTQVYSSGLLFVDTLTDSANNLVKNWPTDGKIIQPTTPANGISRFVLNTHGCKHFIFFCPTGGTIYIDYRRI